MIALKSLLEKILAESVPMGHDSGNTEVARLAREALAELAKFKFVVYPGSEKLDLGPKRPVALCESEGQANAMIGRLWPGFGYHEPM